MNNTAAGASDQVPQLTNILAAAPFDLEIADANGKMCFSSSIAEEAADPHTRRFEIEMGGEFYSLALTLDESERQAYEHELVQRAYFDELTGLPNRSLFEHSVVALIEAGDVDFALALIDIDGFKRVNDYYGHATGDQLLSRIVTHGVAGQEP